MFEINESCVVHEEKVQDSIIYFIDDFYKNPDQVLEFFMVIEPEYHKITEKPSFNSIYFEDKRHIIKSSRISEVYKFLSGICKQNPVNDEIENTIFTNFIRFKNCDFNDYQNNYWWPHCDEGYNGIVYLNTNDSESGTNLYEILNLEEASPKYPEHYRPWKNKANYELIKTIKPKYNRLVLFDGLKFFHGMNICNRDYFNKTYRMNQVFFFKQN